MSDTFVCWALVHPVHSFLKLVYGNQLKVVSFEVFISFEEFLKEKVRTVTKLSSHHALSQGPFPSTDFTEILCSETKGSV